MPTVVFRVSGSPPRAMPIRAPNSGAVKAMGMTRVRGAFLMAA